MEQSSHKPLRWLSAGLVVAFLALTALGIFAASRQGLSDDVVRCGDLTLDNTQLAYFYWSEYFYFAGAYGDYLEGVVDFSKPLSQQAYSESQSWQDYLLEETLATIQETLAMVFAAQAADFTLPEDMQQELETVVENFRTAATEGGYEDLDGYLRASYGAGAEEASFRTYLTWSYLASAYADRLFETIAPTEEEILDYYEGHAGEYLENYGVSRDDPPLPKGVYLPFDNSAEAQSVYGDFLAGGATRELLDNLSAAHQGTTGELEPVTPADVGEAALAWFLDEDRRPEDHAVVEEDDGTAAICYYVAAGEETYWYLLAEDDVRHETYQNQYLSLCEAYPCQVNYNKVRLTAPEGLYDMAGVTGEEQESE